MSQTIIKFLFPLSIALVVGFSLLWFYLRNKKKYEMVDAFWAWSLALAAITIAVFSEGTEERRWLMASLTSIWAIRLGGFLFWGRIRKGLSDGRYENWIKEMGDKVNFKMFLFFQVQALSVIFLSVTFIAVCSAQHTIVVYDFLAIALFLIAILGEWHSDRTLNQFRLNPANKGKVCNIGLWQYSRHPNYFFEWMHWLCYPLFCIGSSTEFLISLIGPLSLLVLILKVSGIPLTEAQAIRSRGQAYKDYQMTTPSFFPNIFRKKKNDFTR